MTADDLNQIRASALVPIPEPTGLAALIERVTCTLASPHSKRAYTSALRRFLTWSSERQLPFTRDTVRTWLGGQVQAQASPSAVNQALAAIRALAREGLDSGALDQGTATAIMAVKGVEQQARRLGRWLDHAQAEILANAPESARDRALLALLLGCGLRRSEVCGLHWNQLQLRGKRSCLADVARKRGRRQIIPLPAWAAERLRQWFAVAMPTPASKIFDLSPTGVAFIVDKWAAECEVEVSCHDLRRTFSGLALKGGADLRSIQSALGHGSVTTTERYLQTMTDLEDAACDKVRLA